MSIPRKACEIPVFDDYYYLSLEGKKLDKERCYDGSGKFAVKVVCFEDSQIILPDNFAVCFDGQWYPSKNTCVLKTCELVYDTYSTRYTCNTPKGVEVNCRLPAEPGTEITIRCAHWRYTFHNSRQNITAIKRFCQKSGEWQTWENCTPPCGLVSNNYTLFEENSNSSLKLVNEFPWSAAIYGYIDDEWKQLCVGTVISLIHVLTASDCVLGMKPGFLRVAFGKYFKNLSDYNQDRVHVVKYALNPPPYRLSILIVAEYIEFNDDVGTACLLGPGEVLDVKLQHFVTRGKDGNQSVITLNCQTSKQPRGNISSEDLLYCSPTSNHTFGPDELGEEVFHWMFYFSHKTQIHPTGYWQRVLISYSATSKDISEWQ
ncbi:hypothetical protein LSTR_LSTR003935 [Laodelphax striatellus]|uniref:Peptidase S1 domain-containing protein n=1 Tax=Laodelphax striatellus TaxID=195883 RepID=A0A482X9D7_LAOST|nr:hypothetical protein LSTR_LSTR003935 [Laodelphax striatellus]